jgi:hypothetical protein
MTKRHRGYMTVEVDLGEALENCSDDMLLQEVEERKLKRVGASDGSLPDDLLDARDELLRGRPAEALAILERILSPKWSNERFCEIALKASRRSAATTRQ